ncbi:hypothetical protein ACIOKD_28015 [Streptomyces sp. NPDC087844]|uniref:hypothetical protein n=1 Tax=Streptomyces sp. NPDC087844 TaxID=3365805 RepID=UPI00382E1741
MARDRPRPGGPSPDSTSCCVRSWISLKSFPHVAVRRAVHGVDLPTCRSLRGRAHYALGAAARAEGYHAAAYDRFRAVNATSTPGRQTDLSLYRIFPEQGVTARAPLRDVLPDPLREVPGA